jgi:hypothetical protein
MIITMSNAPRGGVQIFFGHHNNRAPPLDLAYPKRLNVQSFAVYPRYHKKQIKNKNPMGFNAQ